MNERNHDGQDVTGYAGSMGRNRRSDSEREGYGSRYGGERLGHDSRQSTSAARCNQCGIPYPPPWYGRATDVALPVHAQRNDRWSGAHRGQQPADERRTGYERRRYLR
jgi:hypothetical protein